MKTEIKQRIIPHMLGLSLTFSAAVSAFAQQQKLGISGKITTLGGNAVPYASISFTHKNQPVLSDGSIADHDGNYVLHLSPGTYSLQVEAPGFKTLHIEKTIHTAGALDDIQIQSLTQEGENKKIQHIEGVTITATSTSPYKVALDKKTYDPSADLISAGGTLQDILGNVPSVSVDTDGSISMRGNSNIKFLINGKPSSLLGGDDNESALQSIPADQIEKIEVITNPSSKFEASGTSGILNIILKKNKKSGFSGNVTGSLGYRPKTALSTNLSWKKDNWTWFLNGGGGYTEHKGQNNSEITYKNKPAPLTSSETDVLIHQKQTGENIIYKDKYNLSTGFTYDISSNTSFNISGMLRSFEGDKKQSFNTYNDFSSFTGYKHTLNHRWSEGKSNNLALQGDLGLEHRFNNKGHSLSLSLSLQQYRNDESATIEEITELRSLEKENTDRKSVEKSFIAKADYELPIGEQSKLEAGYRLDSNHSENNSKVIASIPNPLILNYNNTADYQEVFNAFYIQFKSTLGALNYQLGLRDEVSNITINYSNLAAQTIDKTKNYNNLFPSIFLSYNFSKAHQLLINYSRRIDRPISFFLLPFPNYSNNQNIFEGNIDINPSYADFYELGYNLQRKKININPTLYYRHGTDDTKILVYRPDERESVFYTKPINLGTSDRYGLDINFTYDPFPWLKLMGSLDLFGYITTGRADYKTLDKEGQPKMESMNFKGNGFSSSTRLNTTFKIDKSFSLQLQGHYKGSQHTANQKKADMYTLNIGISKSLWKGDGTLSFNIRDVFNTRRMETFNFNDDYIQHNSMQWQPRQFLISLSYQFKQGEKIENSQRKKDNNNPDNKSEDSYEIS
ncbi:TonB-dependent receptor [Elizabethkingia argentiflava]|uniref:TonB-dependent receptor n=1 Tax=Elizabethkingia argenteiflava TaxID=2681556 RepID=A0A845PXD1_9FLAO|nr:TonB-dependent receptor [Elizabethkingia argenteiflava]NAW50988.1 TonB-dependent receptor [Elizabethkingia argenteiflava]